MDPEKGVPKCGLAIMLGDKVADKIQDVGVDIQNAFLWIVLTTTTGLIGIVNLYALHKPKERGRIWCRMQNTLDPTIPWIVGGDCNFIERSKDRKGGTRFVPKEEDSWHVLRDIHLGVGDPWILKPEAIAGRTTSYTWRNKQALKPMMQHIDRFYVPLGWVNRVSRMEILARAVRSDHYPIRMDLGLSDKMPKEKESRVL